VIAEDKSQIFNPKFVPSRFITGENCFVVPRLDFVASSQQRSASWRFAGSLTYAIDDYLSESADLPKSVSDAIGMAV
jgi:hypothetical protein